VAGADTPFEGGDPGAIGELDAFLRGAIARRVFPGAVAAFGRTEGPVVYRAVGHLTYEPDEPVEVGTRYDLASLTKVVATTTAAMVLVEDGALALDEPVAARLPEFGRAGKGGVTARHLLTHAAGLVPYPGYPVERFTTGRALLDAIHDAPPLYVPGTETRYSEVGMIVLAQVVERVAGEPFSAFVRRRVLEPLGMRRSGFFGDGGAAALEVAPTGYDDRFRGRMIRGEVHAPMAAVLGGTSGSSGLYGDAPDLVRFVRMMLRRGATGAGRLLSEETVRALTVPADAATTDTRALGWDTRSPRGYTVAGTSFGPRSYGHTGDTGTSIWVDPEADVFVVLLSNRTFPTRENRAHVHVRPAVSDLAWRAVLGPLPARSRDAADATTAG
jgi:CubicO group peptidase (beta-lactamase class C family)